MPMPTITFAPHIVPNTGSAARDYCMLERNLLSHLKLALVLSLLSSSLLLRARLVPDTGDNPSNAEPKIGLPLAGVEIAAAFAAIIAAVWEYQSGYRDLRSMRAFLVAPRTHFAIMSVVVTAVFATCVVLLADGN